MTDIEGEKNGIVYKIVTKDMYDALLDFFLEQDLDSKLIHLKTIISCSGVTCH